MTKQQQLLNQLENGGVENLQGCTWATVTKHFNPSSPQCKKYRVTVDGVGDHLVFKHYVPTTDTNTGSTLTGRTTIYRRDNDNRRVLKVVQIQSTQNWYNAVFYPKNSQ